jgi:ribosomal protein S18 acetylase RimI-like enzyme
MAEAYGSPAPGYEPDPFELQIAAAVIRHRADLLAHDKATYDELVQASNDYLWYGRLLEKSGGHTPPWDVCSENETTPPEVFFETAELVGYMQSIPRPSLGVDRRHFRLLPRAQADKGRFAPTPAMAHALAVVELVQHPDRRWQVLHAEVEPSRRRQGIATMLYGRIEAVLDTMLHPSGWLSDDAYKFWQSWGSPVLHYYIRVDHFPGIWISPKALLTLKIIAEARLRLMKDPDG